MNRGGSGQETEFVNDMLKYYKSALCILNLHLVSNSYLLNLNNYSNENQERIDELKQAGCVTPWELENLQKEVLKIQNPKYATYGTVE